MGIPSKDIMTFFIYVLIVAWVTNGVGKELVKVRLLLID